MQIYETTNRREYLCLFSHEFMLLFSDNLMLLLCNNLLMMLLLLLDIFFYKLIVNILYTHHYPYDSDCRHNVTFTIEYGLVVHIII